MVCRLVLNSRAKADTDAPSPSRRTTCLPLLRRQARRPAQALALGLRPAQPRLGALDQEVALELRNRIDDVHRQLAGRAREVDAAQGQAVDPTPLSASFATVAPTSMALRPSRLSLLTTARRRPLAF